ncbi:ATP-binding protein [Pigmentiphaga sp.]|uniref:sensor histidine kinase n=1 Tax=Pigmentiphaga sp. TaxID=1977564 RepID=UPI0025DA2284|nr:ATP-binding protein [Pigmentiphaga sp.]
MTGTRARRSHEWGKLIAWILLVAITAAIGALPHLVDTSPPQGTLAITDARFIQEGESPEQAVSLPHHWMPETLYELTTGSYRLSFHVPDVPGESMFLFIPAVRHRVEAWVNGRRADAAPDTVWSAPTSGYSFLARIPDGAIQAGDNEILLRQTRKIGWLPGRLSQVSVGTAAAVMPAYQLSNFLIEEVRAMTFALHIALTLGIASIWTARRHDPVFGWLAAMSITSILIVLTQSPHAALGTLEQFQSISLVSAVGLMAIGMALAIVGRRRPRQLLPAVIAAPAFLLVLGQTGLVPFPVIGLLSACITLSAYVVAAGILAHQFTQNRNWDAAIMVVPCVLTAWFGVHDVLVVTGRYDDPFLLASYARTLMLLAIMVILMGRLARSLNSLDHANDTLRQKLATREAELGLAHEKEKVHANQMVREQERQRLMRDLHDGMSGHLVAIIALSERNPEGGQAIERAARAALDDLRLVVHSLDLGDGDLGVALAAFRERLEPQLRRLGIAFHWSTEKLPAVTGVTPQNALSVLRILQEAVTNAIRHGPARRLSIEGGTTGDGMATLRVSNDGGRPRLAGAGNGLRNMQRRARELGGRVEFTMEEDGARLLLVLPARLPE